ncbi:probable F420-dependent oxidoreductase, Rv3520c family [Friedmanniella luteola]|uniref:Probable F420-dependent oxidoreductase, Rv3520c family n=1 Tax=Friedmanniella luteola TaxID=546871 RepID=A0A1H1QMQ1_9ACTN|nr:LLM class F420-dependent oxidoreductase [Friedmanniella luteola]SDS24761.1 probable F420-dependent oxidoreductase, Rv3520c family [Friedmanniella luteola]
MRLGLNLGYLVGAEDPQGQLRLTAHAEALGFEVVWAAEAYGSDSPTVLAWLAGQTRRIAVGSAVMQIPARTPAMTAMTAASLDVLSGGRFRLGLGVSGPQVSEGWHGVRFDKPLARTREYLAVLELALARQTVVHEGTHYPLPLPDGPGKPLKLTIAPVSTRIPTYLAAVGPRNLELAGELTDGWLAVFYAPDFADEQLAAVAAGRAKVGRTLEGFDVVPTFPLVVGADPRACADPVRGYAALYLGGMGSRTQNFYNALAVRMGYGEAAAAVQDLFLDRRQRDAMAAVPYEFIDATSLLGDRDRLTERLQVLAASGVTTCSVVPYGETVEQKLAALTVLADAFDRAAVG